jgi:hypothetical protein
MNWATDIMKVKMVKGGLFMWALLMHQKYQLNGIRGCILRLIELKKKHNLEKYDWQKPHQSNLTGTNEAYYPNKNKDVIKKKYSSWKE